jgi:hypothetical protein
MDTTHKIIIGAYAAVVMVVVAIAAFLLIGRLTPSSNVAFAVPEFEADALTGEPQGVDESLAYKTIELGDDLTISMCTSLAVDESSNVEVDFTSLSTNSSWVRLVILDADGTELGSTGILKPGQYVKDVAVGTPSASSVDATIKVLTYEPETYYSEGSASASVTLTS